ncbi:hypothetical protein ACYULU_05380 [Breznakiellaceae bacterium SP9]
MQQLKVVSNTTPILSLVKIEKLELLKDLFGSIFVPKAVYREIEVGRNKKYYADLAQTAWEPIMDFRKACKDGSMHCRRNIIWKKSKKQR